MKKQNGNRFALSGNSSFIILHFPSALPENVNYAVKSREGRHVAVPNFRDADTASLPVLESVSEVAKKLNEPNTKDEKFEEVVKSAQGAAVLVLVY